MSSTSRIASLLKEPSAQSTVEAAFAIPILMILILLILQPGIVLYDHIVMKGACADACRLLTTVSDSSSEPNEDYVRRRLSAIPQIDIFHVHSSGCSYEINLTGNESSQSVGVEIINEIKPLPLLDIGMSLLDLVNDNGNITLKAHSSLKTQPDWALASTGGSSPSEWVMK